jgi:L-serine dehydratase
MATRAIARWQHAEPNCSLRHVPHGSKKFHGSHCCRPNRWRLRGTPGAVIAVAEELGLSEEQMAHALLAAGLIGVFITGQWTFAAEVGGCQAEGGAAACMAGAALVTLSNGSLKQSLAASSLAFQSMLGLICDPIANRVEAPCLGKNVMAASNALCCANMALADFDPLIPLDEVIWAAKDVASKMPREHRCTSLGGLAITPTSLKIEQELNKKKRIATAAVDVVSLPSIS